MPKQTREEAQERDREHKRQLRDLERRERTTPSGHAAQLGMLLVFQRDWERKLDDSHPNFGPGYFIWKTVRSIASKGVFPYGFVFKTRNVITLNQVFAAVELESEDVLKWVDVRTSVQVPDDDRDEWNLKDFKDQFDMMAEFGKEINTLEHTLPSLGMLLLGNSPLLQNFEAPKEVQDKYHYVPVGDILISVAGTISTTHLDFFLRGIVAHVVYGRKIFFSWPPNENNLGYHVGRQHNNYDIASPHSAFKRLTDLYVSVVEEGHTIVLPPGHFHLVMADENSSIVGARLVPKRLDLGYVKRILKYANEDTLGWKSWVDAIEGDLVECKTFAPNGSELATDIKETCRLITTFTKSKEMMKKSESVE